MIEVLFFRQKKQNYIAILILVISLKKIILTSILFIILGFLIGNKIFGNISNDYYKNRETYYFLQEGVYTDEDILKNNLKKISQKVIDIQDDKYYVYVGITKDEEVAETLKKIYEEKGVNIYQKEKQIKSEEFLNNVNQFDLLIKETKDEDQILTIEEVVLANYKEIIKKQ